MVLYVATIGAYMVSVLGPLASSLGARTAAMETQVDSTRARLVLLGDATVETRRLVLARPLTAQDRQRVSILRSTIGQVAEQSAGLRASLHLPISPVIRAALAEAASAESNLAGSLVVTLDYLGHGDTEAAIRELSLAESARQQLVTRLDDAQRLGLDDLAAGQRTLGTNARRIVSAIALWVMLGSGLLGLVLLALHRRIYLPLASLDAGMARVAKGYLQTSLPINRNDEFGRLAAAFNKMTEVLRSRPEIEALRDSERKYRALFESADDAILLFADGRWVDANAGALTVFGCTREQIIGAHPSRFSPPRQPDGQNSEAAAIQKITRAFEERPQRFEWEHCRSDGTLFAAEVSLNRIDVAGTPHILAIVRDVTQRKRAETVLAEEKQNLDALFESSPVALLLLDDTTSIVRVNEAAVALTGGSVADFLDHRPGNALRCVHSSEDPRGCGFASECPLCPLRNGIEARIASGDSMHGAEIPIELIRDGQPRKTWMRIGAEPVQFNRVRHLLVALDDVTERREAETRMLGLLHDKEVLLKEVQHRVKNNLQIITSLMRLESARSVQPGTKETLESMQGRIRTMAKLHETLTHSGRYASIDLGAYLKGLTIETFRALATSPDTVTFRLDLASVPIEMDRAMPCGLLVNELLTNSLTHGFPDGRQGEVLVELHEVDGGRQLRLRISDTGIGLPPDLATRQESSLGFQLISDLVTQLGGTLEIGPGSAPVFTVTFAVRNAVPA